MNLALPRELVYFLFGVHSFYVIFVFLLRFQPLLLPFLRLHLQLLRHLIRISGKCTFRTKLLR